MEVQVDAAGVQDTQDDLLAPHRRQRRNAQVDAATAQLDGDPAVLRHPALGDVDVRHDLEATDQSRLHGAGDGVDLVQNAVDSVAHPQVSSRGLDVQVGGAVVDRLLDQRVHIPDDRGIFLNGVEAVQGRRVVAAEARRDVVEVVLGALEPVDRLVELVPRHHDRAYLKARGRADVVDGEYVAGVCHRDDDLVVVDGDAEHPVATRHRDRDLGGGREVDRVAHDVDALEPVRLGKRVGELDLGDHPLIDQDVTQQPA